MRFDELGTVDLTVDEWIGLLEQPGIFDEESLQLLFYTMKCPGQMSTNYDMGKAFGVHPNKIAAVNRSLSKRIFATLGIKAPKEGNRGYRYWDVCFIENQDELRDKRNHFYWCVRDTLADALTILFEDELSNTTSTQNLPFYQESAAKTMETTTYERNPAARKACLQHYGHKCSVCKMDYATVYGSVGEDKIHVHHTVPLSAVGATHCTNPIEDLRPVCANCHLIIHARNPPYTIEEVKEMMKAPKST